MFRFSTRTTVVSDWGGPAVATDDQASASRPASADARTARRVSIARHESTRVDCVKARIDRTAGRTYDRPRTMRTHRSLLRALALAMLTAAVLSGCGVYEVGPNTIVNGWSIGEESPCEAGCEDVISAATERLAGRDPLHAPIIRTTLHAEGLYPNDDGDLGQIFRSGMGGFSGVVLFQLGDGTYRAIGYGRLPPHLGSKPTTRDFGPERRPGRTDHGIPFPTVI